MTAFMENRKWCFLAIISCYKTNCNEQLISINQWIWKSILLIAKLKFIDRQIQFQNAIYVFSLYLKALSVITLHVGSVNEKLY